MELTPVIAATMLQQLEERQIPLPADAVMLGKVFQVIENDGEFAIAEELADGIMVARIRLTPDYQIGQRVRFVHFN